MRRSIAWPVTLALAALAVVRFRNAQPATASARMERPGLAAASRLDPSVPLSPATPRAAPAVHEARVPASRARRPRALLVVDEADRALPGVAILHGSRPLATTDEQGHALLLPPEQPFAELTLFAPGRRWLAIPAVPREEPWVVRLPRANRLEITLAAGADPRSHHALVRLAPSFTQRTFQQSRYEFTPGRPVEGTAGWWSEKLGQGSTWDLGFTAEGRAVLDHLDDHGTVEIELWSFEQQLDSWTAELPEGGGLTRVTLASPLPADTLDVHVVDASGRPIAGARVGFGARTNAHLSPTLSSGLPAWAPVLTTDGAGLCRLPLPTSPEVRVAVAAEGFALASTNAGELAASGGWLVLEPACRVEFAVRDREGEPLCANGASWVHSVEPYVRLPHEQWLSARRLGNEVFELAALPCTEVEVHFTFLAEVLLQDTRVPLVLHRTEGRVDDYDLDPK